MTANSAFLGTLYAQIAVNTTSLDHAMVKMQQFNTASRKALMGVAKNFTAAGAAMKTFGRNMTQFMTVPMVLVGGAALKMYADFEFSMNKVVSLVGVARKQVDEWTKSVLALGPTVGKSPRELADAMYFITSAGIRGKETLEILEESAKSSAGGLGEVKVVADLLTSAMNAYGKENLSAAQANDVLVATVREGKAEAALLAQSMGLVLPIASAMGATFDQVGAATAAMTRTGTKAATAAIQLRQIFNSILKPAKEAEEALGNMGTSSAELRKMIRDDGLLAALEELSKISKEYGIEMLGKVIPNIRSLTGVLDIMGENAEENALIFEAIKNSAGDANRMFQETADTIKFRMQQAFARVQKSLVMFGASLSKVLIPLLERTAVWIEGLAERFDNLSEAQKRTIVTIGAVVAALGPLVTILGFLVGSVVPMVIKGFAMMSTKAVVLGTTMVRLVKFLATQPWALLAVAITGVTLALITYFGKAKEVLNIQEQLYQRGFDFDELAEEEKQAIIKRLRWTGVKKKMLLLDAIAEEDRTKKLEKTYGRTKDLLGQIGVFEQERMMMLPSLDDRQLEDAEMMIISYRERIDDELLTVRAILKENESNWAQIDFAGIKVLEEGTKKAGGFLSNMTDMYGSAYGEVNSIFEDSAEKRQWAMHDMNSAVAREGQAMVESLVQQKRDMELYAEAVEDAMKKRDAALSSGKREEEIATKSAALNAVLKDFKQQLHSIAMMEKFTGDTTASLTDELSLLDQSMKALTMLTLGATEGQLKVINDQLAIWAERTGVVAPQVEALKGKIVTLNSVMADLNTQLDVADVMGQVFGDKFNMVEEHIYLVTDALEKLVKNGVQGAEKEIAGLVEILGDLQYELYQTDKFAEGMKGMKALGAQIELIANIGKLGVKGFQPALESFLAYQNELKQAQSSGEDANYVKFLSEGLADAWGDLSIGQKIQVFAKENQKQLRMIAQNFRQLWGGIGELIEANMATEIATMETIAQKKNKTEKWIAKEREKIEKQYAKRRRAMMIGEAIAGVAIAVINALQTQPFIPLGLIAAGIAAAAGAVQVAAIAAAPMAKGGIIPSGYPNDSFPALLTSGEEVLPARRRSRDDMMGGEVVFKIEGDELVGILKKRESVNANF